MHGRILQVLISCLIAFSFLQGEAQNSDLLVFRKDKKVYLRWKAVLDQEPVGYKVYARGDVDESWRLVTQEPLRMAFEGAAIRQRVGNPTGLFLTLFGVNDPNGKISPQQYQAFLSDPKAVSFMEIMTLVNPELGKALGVIYIDSNIMNAPRRQYRINTLIGTDEQPYATSELIDVKVDDVIPQVMGVTGEGNDQSALLRWGKNKVALSSGEVVTYRVYRSNDLFGNYDLVNLAGILPVTVSSGDITARQDSMEYTDHYLENGKTYYYFVKAVNAFGLEGPASPVVKIVPRDTRVPMPPFGLTADRFGTGVGIHWRSNTDNLSGFEVFKSGSRKDGYVKIFPKDDLLLDTATWFVDLYVTEGKQYYYYIRAVSKAGIRSPSSDTLFYYLEDHTAPSAPGPVRATGEKGRIVLSWPANPEPDVIGYEVERSSDLAFRSRFLLTNNILYDTMYRDTLPAVSQTVYGYVVYAVDASNNRSKPSDMVKARMIDQAPPLSPIMNGLQKNGNQVLLMWTKRTEPDLAAYRIYRAVQSPQAFKAINLSFTNSYTDTLKGPGKYFYAVTAMDSAGNESPLSVYLSLDYDEKEVPMPSASGEVRKEKGALLIDWEPVQQPGTAGYLVTREDPETGKKTDIAQVKAIASSFLDRYADTAKSHNYYIRTFDTKFRQSEPLILYYQP